MRIGTMIRGGVKTISYLERFIPIGIESVQLFFWDRVPDDVDESWLESVAGICRNSDISISSLGFFANPFRGEEEFSSANDGWNRLLKLAGNEEIPIVSGFTGRVPGLAVDESLEPVKSFFTPLLETAQDLGVKLAFENCSMDGNWSSGDWNIAFSPEAWNILFNDLFNTDSVGLEFDPSHCPALNQNALALAKEWLPKIIHTHGKDASPADAHEFCFPGKGVFQWPAFVSLLENSGYSGTLDLEGYHGAFTSHEDEVERQAMSLSYLKGLDR